jgi:thiol-disulfide isomerase/thioredoxin/Tfp pilus assembly protein PilF
VKIMFRNSIFPLTALMAGVISFSSFGAAQNAPAKAAQPTDPKAQKTFAEAQEYQRRGNLSLAVDDFRKADKQDGGHCAVCLQRAYRLALDTGDYKTAGSVISDWLPRATDNAYRATLHFQLGVALERQGIAEKKDRYFEQSSDEFKQAIALDPTVAGAYFGSGIVLAYLHQDEAARAEFTQFLNQEHSDPVTRARAQRYVERVELARARVAPPFRFITIDGRQVSMDDLVGKVVLIDFWATWCGPCREALPHMRKIVQKFQGEPFVAISVSLDSDDKKWRKFVGENEMTWFQYRDGAGDGSMAQKFAVHEIPATFSIDADGVLEDQHVGDANIEGKLKKLIAQAQELQNRKPELQAAGNSSGGSN